MLPDDGDRLGGSDVVARAPVVVAACVEVVREELLATRKTVPATHAEIMADANRGSQGCATLLAS